MCKKQINNSTKLSLTDEQTAHSKKRVLESLKKTMGMVTLACEDANVSRSSFYSWIKSDKDFKQNVLEINDRTGDMVETRLLKNIKEGENSAIIFYCKTKLKDRGYVERTEQEISGRGGKPIQNMQITQEEARRQADLLDSDLDE